MAAIIGGVLLIALGIGLTVASANYPILDRVVIFWGLPFAGICMIVVGLWRICWRISQLGKCRIAVDENGNMQNVVLVPIKKAERVLGELGAQPWHSADQQSALAKVIYKDLIGQLGNVNTPDPPVQSWEVAKWNDVFILDGDNGKLSARCVAFDRGPAQVVPAQVVGESQ